VDYIDYYKVLGVGKKATKKEIKSAYRKMARKHHPDVNPGDKNAEKKFQELNEANEVLSDPEKRKKYDKYGKDWKHAEQFEKQEQQQRAYSQQRGQQSYAGGGAGYEGDFSDFFSSMFGGGGGFGGGQGRSQSMKGQDLTAELHLPLRQAANTHKQTITVNGKKIRITIPAGISDGQTIKIKGQGGPGMQGGPKGDLYITFRIDKDPVFERKGNNLYIKKKVDLYTLVLGGELEVETLHGKVKIKVKAGTNPGSKIRLKNKGFPVYKDAHKHGDLYVTLDSDIPKDLSKKEKELFEELKNLRK
jgi:curved DNA-binding protein